MGRAAVEAMHVLEVAGLSQIFSDEAYVAFIVELVPDGDGLIWKAAVRMSADSTLTAVPRVRRRDVRRAPLVVA